MLTRRISPQIMLLIVGMVVVFLQLRTLVQIWF
jgi:Na+-transporting methylmalonyl-CoA/oxaloacetate decarboxylase gamma subunit